MENMEVNAAHRIQGASFLRVRKNIARQGYWRNKAVLVTGYEGFLGSNLTQCLVENHAKVIGLDIKVNRKTTILSRGDYQSIRVIRGDVANYELVRKLLFRYKIEAVFHLAAEAIVGRSISDPMGTFSSNICGTWSVMEACRKNPRVKAIIVASSDKAYGTSNKLPYQENTPLAGAHPYDVSKSCADLIAHAYYHTYHLPVAVTRCGNIFGPGDFNFSRIVPDAVRCALLNNTLLIRSDGKYTRDYIYVDDVVDGYLLIAEKMGRLDLAGEAFNFSNEKPISVLALIGSIDKLMGKGRNYKVLNRVRNEIKHQYLSSSKARKKLQWKPQHNLIQGLEKTIFWYKRQFLPVVH